MGKESSRMIVGIGTDIIELRRIETVLTRFGQRFWQRILNEAEQLIFKQKHEFAQARFLAKRFAAKEAVSKALGTGISQGISFHDIEIQNNTVGKPLVLLHHVALELAQAHQINNIQLSLSDAHTMIVAFVVLERL